MKTFNKYKFLGILLIFVFASSCKKYLSTPPDNRTEINSVQKVAQLLSTAYPYYDYLTFAESASDNAEDKGLGIGNLNEAIVKPYYWQDVIGPGANNAGGFWNASYEAIAAANQALYSIETENLGNEALPYKGEALVARAYSHFMLALFFAKPYEVGGANNSPGIPYLTSPENKVIVKYDRGTVQSTYDNIKKDLEEGIKLLSASAYSAPKFHFTPAAANAFASRFYLFIGKWKEAADAATLTVPSNDFTSNMRKISTDLKNLTSSEFRLAFNQSTQKYNLLLTVSYSSYYSLMSTPRYGYGPRLSKMFTNPNISGKILQNNVLSYSSNDFTTYKYSNYFFVTTSTGLGANLVYVPLFTVDEALMNRAEANVELGKFNDALNDINTFLSVRLASYNPLVDAVTLDKIKNFYNMTDPKEGLIKTILDLKKAEFLQEGIRWMDIVRRRLTVVHNVYNEANEQFIELKPDDPRRLFQMPEEVKLSGLEPNPR